MAVCAAVALGIGVLTRPAPTTCRAPARETRRSPRWPGRCRSGRPALAVAAVTRDGTRTAVFGTTPETRFEIGSLTKGLTGLLFADMIARGEVAPTTTVGALLPVHGPLAGVTLEQLATHRSGLPWVPGGPAQRVRGWWNALTAANPYPYTSAQILDAAAHGALDAPPGTVLQPGLRGARRRTRRDGGPAVRAARHRTGVAPLGMVGATVLTTPDALGPRGPDR